VAGSQGPQGGDGLDSSQLCVLFENCLKLASENKITAKNTWDLPLIDHLSDLVQVPLLLFHAPGKPLCSQTHLHSTCTACSPGLVPMWCPCELPVPSIFAHPGWKQRTTLNHVPYMQGMLS
jgi:hypothetical protein